MNVVDIEEKDKLICWVQVKLGTHYGKIHMCARARASPGQF